MTSGFIWGKKLKRFISRDPERVKKEILAGREKVPKKMQKLL